MKFLNAMCFINKIPFSSLLVLTLWQCFWPGNISSYVPLYMLFTNSAFGVGVPTCWSLTECHENIKVLFPSPSILKLLEHLNIQRRNNNTCTAIRSLTLILFKTQMLQLQKSNFRHYLLGVKTRHLYRLGTELKHHSDLV